MYIINNTNVAQRLQQGLPLMEVFRQEIRNKPERQIQREICPVTEFLNMGHILVLKYSPRSCGMNMGI